MEYIIWRIKMQKCSNCNKEFTWKEVFRVLMGNSKLKCSKCGTFHVITTGSSVKYKLFCLGVPLIIGKLIKPYSFKLAALVVVVLVILFVALVTFIVKFKPVSKDYIKGRL